MSYRPPPRPLRRSGRRGIVSLEATMPPFAAYSPEQRLIRAFSSVVAAEGYSATTIADIAAAASISQTTFYLYFTDKADALAAALDSSGAQMIAASLPSARRAPDWPSAVRIGFEATCGWMASEPDFAKLRMVEVYAAGPAAITIRDRGGTEFLGALLDPAAEAGIEVSAIVLEATIGAVYGLFHEQVRRGNVANLPEFAPLLTYLALAPVLDPEQAYRVASETGPTQRRR
jgi:AcrR family transcriptional regulator